MRRSAFNAADVPMLLRESGPTPANPAYWETRLLRGTFTAEARPGSEKELFARYEHEGQWIYFPLESSVPAEAAVRACDIYRLLTASGWDAVCGRYVRQIVWAIFWFSEPLTCTYATLFTVPERKTKPWSPSPPKPSSPIGMPQRGRGGLLGGEGQAHPRLPTARNGNPVPVALIEPSAEVRRGLEQGLKHSSGYVCVQTAALAKELLDRPTAQPNAPKLILFNQRSLDLAADAFQEELQARWPGTIAVPFGVYGHSDELFMTIHGMDNGYFLRRRTPRQLLEPVEGLWQAHPICASPPPTPSRIAHRVRGRLGGGEGQKTCPAPHNCAPASRLIFRSSFYPAVRTETRVRPAP